MTRPRLARAALLLLSTLVALAAAETFLRVRGLYPPPDYPLVPVRPEMFQPDPEIGYRLWPSRQMSYSYPPKNPRVLPVISNSDGFRSGREFDEHDGRGRILLIGDSFVFGEGVTAEERVSEQLEALEPGWRVDSMGMPGWGLDLMVRALERYGQKTHPDAVVLAVYTDDFRRLVPNYAGLGYAYPKFELTGSGLVSTPYRYPSLWERLRLVQWISGTRWERNRNRYDLNGALLDRFLKDTDQLRARPFVTFFPGRGDNDEDRDRRGFLAQWAASHQVGYVDLTTPIQEAGVANVYITGNFHWNHEGHALAARELARGLGPLHGTPSWPTGLIVPQSSP